MRVVFLSKRRYMRRDVLNDRYGRLYQLPSQLAAAGAQVDAIVASYDLALPKSSVIANNDITWQSYVLPISLGSYLGAIRRAAARADAVFVSSDCFHVALGGWLKETYNKRLVVDLYDNYESFGMARLPFIRHRYYRGLRAADLICCNGDMLAQYAKDRTGAVETIVLRSTIDKDAFQAKPKHSSRVALGLHGTQRLVGLVGGLSASRGVQYVYKACRNLVKQGFELGLVLAGGADTRWPIPSDKWVTYLGDLPHDKMVDFYNAVDLNVIQVRPDAFGSYCFPQKADEILATGSPFIAANVGELASVFGRYPEILFDPENVAQIQAVIRKQILSPTKVSVKTGTWTESVRQLFSKLEDLCGDRGNGAAQSVAPAGKKI